MIVISLLTNDFDFKLRRQKKCAISGLEKRIYKFHAVNELLFIQQHLSVEAICEE